MPADKNGLAASRQPPAASRQPPAASRQPPAASRQPPAASRQPPAASYFGTNPSFNSFLTYKIRSQLGHATGRVVAVSVAFTTWIGNAM